MASSSATASSDLLYDVFLSFRGETRYKFTDHLFRALNQAGFNTFRDDAIARGRQLSDELAKAIRHSAITLIVFSKGFASSDWCLDEVMISIEASKTPPFINEVVPFFYEVNPSDIKELKGTFKKVFDAHVKKLKSKASREERKELAERVEAWKDSLSKAATLTGVVYNEGYETKFIDDILNIVKEKVGKKGQYVGDKIVGTDGNVDKIQAWLDNSSPEAAVLLIAGMGGIGKSTIAKCIYNLNFRKPIYDGSCFLEEINKTASNEDRALCHFQRQLLSTVLKRPVEETVWGLGEGTAKIEAVISSKRKLLLILDDVATSRQIEVLLGSKTFYRETKVIITTRNTMLSSDFKVPPTVHVVKNIPSSLDLVLFSLHAFNDYRPPDPYMILSKQFVSYCMGHPFSLVMWGTDLRKYKTVDAWKDRWRFREQATNPMLQKSLEASYDNLEIDLDKHVFLHIACFFEGDKKDYIETLLTECELSPVSSFETLAGVNMLYIENGRVKMHQPMKAMGREVVRKESDDVGERSRLWRCEDCFDVLKDRSGTKKVKGLMLDRQETNKDEIFSITALEKMYNLMLLQLKYVTFSGECNEFPRKLRLLSWHGFSLNSIQGNLCLKNLVVLDLSRSNVERLQNDFMDIETLKILNLSHSEKLIETPDLGGLPGLETLVLEGCSNLIKVHESIGNLIGIALLDVTKCRSLTSLPVLPEFVKVLKDGCPNLLREL